MMRGAAGGCKAGGYAGWRLAAAAWTICAVILTSIAVIRAESTSDFRDFWENAVHFRQTGRISAELGVHNYLPVFTILMAPWGWLPLRVAVAAFVLLSMVLLAWTVVAVERLVCGPPGPRPRAATIAAAGLMLPYVTSCAVLGQLGLLLAALIVASAVALARQRQGIAGVALGLAGCLKILPAMVLAACALCGRFRALLAGVTTLAVLGAGLPLALLGVARTRHEHAAFFQRAVVQHSAVRAILADQPVKANFANNALPLVLRRVLSRTNAGKGDGAQAWYVNVAELPRPVILGIYVAIVTFVLAASVAVTLAPRPAHEPRGSPGERRRLTLRLALWCCVALIASPLVWTHYLTLLYLPLALVSFEALRVRRVGALSQRCCLAALVVWLICAVLLAWPAARAMGAQMASVLALWFALLVTCVTVGGVGGQGWEKR